MRPVHTVLNPGNNSLMLSPSTVYTLNVPILSDSLQAVAWTRSVGSHSLMLQERHLVLEMTSPHQRRIERVEIAFLERLQVQVRPNLWKNFGMSTELEKHQIVHDKMHVGDMAV